MVVCGSADEIAGSGDGSDGKQMPSQTQVQQTHDSLTAPAAGGANTTGKLAADAAGLLLFASASKQKKQ